MHRHLATHGILAFDYYQLHVEARADLLASLMIETKAQGACRLWTGLADEGGYGRVRVAGAPTGAAHRIALWAATGDMLPGLYVLHSCDTPACINPDHLSWGTPTANAIEREERGRGGARRRVATKLCHEDALEIRRRHADGESRGDLAAAFGVTASCVDHVTAGRTWKAADKCEGEP